MAADPDRDADLRSLHKWLFDHLSLRGHARIGKVARDTAAQGRTGFGAEAVAAPVSMAAAVAQLPPEDGAQRVDPDRSACVLIGVDKYPGGKRRRDAPGADPRLLLQRQGAPDVTGHGRGHGRGRGPRGAGGGQDPAEHQGLVRDDLRHARPPVPRAGPGRLQRLHRGARRRTAQRCSGRAGDARAARRLPGGQGPGRREGGREGGPAHAPGAPGREPERRRRKRRPRTSGGRRHAAGAPTSRGRSRWRCRRAASKGGASSRSGGSCPTWSASPGTGWWRSRRGSGRRAAARRR